MDHRWKYPLEVFTFLAAAAVLLLSNVGQSAEESFIDSCRTYAKKNDTVSARYKYQPFESEELMKLLASGTVDEWKKALADDDPKVRTLGILAIGLGDDPSLLPLLEPFLDDKSPTFRLDTSRIYSYGSPFPPNPNVLYFARKMVKEWLLEDRISSKEGFNMFWSQAEDPEKRVSVWKCRLMRACEWTRPRLPNEPISRGPGARRAKLDLRGTQKEIEAANEAINKWREDCQKHVLPVRERMKKELAPEMVVVIALVLDARYSKSPRADYEFWTTDEIRKLVKNSITKDYAIACLDYRPPFSDPYLNPELWGLSRSTYLGFMRNLLLYFDWRPEDAAALLDLEQKNVSRKHSSRVPEFVLAASRAQKNKGKSLQILREALARQSFRFHCEERTRWAMEVLAVGGETEVPYLADYFYNESERWQDKGDFACLFLQLIHGPNVDTKRLVAAIVKDERSSAITFRGVKILVNLCSDLAGEEVIPRAEVTDLDRAVRADRDARKKDPKGLIKHPPEDKQAVLDVLTDWRKRLTEYVEKHDW